MELVFMTVLFAVVGLRMSGPMTLAVEEPPKVIFELAIENSHRKEEQRSTRCHRGGEAWP
jgi:hypothetical protein